MNIKCVHCQDFPHCRKENSEPFYGVLNCGCSACDCVAEKPDDKSGKEESL